MQSAADRLNDAYDGLANLAADWKSTGGSKEFLALAWQTFRSICNVA